MKGILEMLADKFRNVTATKQGFFDGTSLRPPQKPRNLKVSRLRKIQKTSRKRNRGR